MSWLPGPGWMGSRPAQGQNGLLAVLGKLSGSKSSVPRWAACPAAPGVQEGGRTGHGGGAGGPLQPRRLYLVGGEER